MLTRMPSESGLPAAAAAHLDEAQLSSVAAALIVLASADAPGAPPDAAPALLALLGAMPGGAACAAGVVAAAFRLRHWALVHQAAASFATLCAENGAHIPALRLAVPSDAAVGGGKAVKELLVAVATRRSDAARAAARAALAGAAEAEALEADGDALYNASEAMMGALAPAVAA